TNSPARTRRRRRGPSRPASAAPDQLGRAERRRSACPLHIGPSTNAIVGCPGRRRAPGIQSSWKRWELRKDAPRNERSRRGRDVLYVAEIPMPTAEAGEAVVEVRAAAINPGEASIRTGALHERFPATFPSGQGSDLAGVVSAVGDGVE